MDEDEIVIEEVERRACACFPFFLKRRICEPRHPARGHPYIKVVPLSIGRADVLHAGSPMMRVLMVHSAGE